MRRWITPEDRRSNRFRLRGKFCIERNEHQEAKWRFNKRNSLSGEVLPRISNEPPGRGRTSSLTDTGVAQVDR